MGRYKPKQTNHEFDLDLAPLLSVMVKLVPVLLLSSAFVQVMVIETDLPQAVQEVIQQQDPNPTTAVQLKIDNNTGFQVVIQKGSEQKTHTIPMKDKSWDTAELNKYLSQIKMENPEIFKIEFTPEANVLYSDIVKIMDSVRKAHAKDLKFPVPNKKTGTTVYTEFMFPDVVFTNVMDG